MPKPKNFVISQTPVSLRQVELVSHVFSLAALA